MRNDVHVSYNVFNFDLNVNRTLHFIYPSNCVEWLTI